MVIISPLRHSPYAEKSTSVTNTHTAKSRSLAENPNNCRRGLRASNSIWLITSRPIVYRPTMLIQQKMVPKARNELVSDSVHDTLGSMRINHPVKIPELGWYSSSNPAPGVGDGEWMVVVIVPPFRHSSQAEKSTRTGEKHTTAPRHLTIALHLSATTSSLLPILKQQQQ